MSNDEEETIPSLFKFQKFSFAVESALAISETIAIVKQLNWLPLPSKAPSLTSDQRWRFHILANQKDPLHNVVDPVAFNYCLYFGRASHQPLTDSDTTSNETDARLYCVFPHLRRDISDDHDLLRHWHDRIVLPAFEAAWGTTNDPTSQLSMPKYDDLRSNSSSSTTELPWPDVAACGSQRAQIALYNDSWRLIQKAVRQDPKLRELDDVFLATVLGQRIEANDSLEEAYEKAQTGCWAQQVNAKEVKDDLLRVTFRVVPRIFRMGGGTEEEGGDQSRVWRG